MTDQLTIPIPRPMTTPAENVGPRAASRWWALLAWLVAVVLLASHDIGRQTFDTKLGVDIDPVGFYQRLTMLWNPTEWFGGLQDQYIGYAFPMGTFYLAGHALAVPVWLVERLWMALLVAAGFWGLVRLAEALRIGGPRTRLLAGAVFALWPTYTILIGSTSAATLPGLLAPWAVLPLVRDTTSPRVAAARSGVVVLAMGGVNAVSTIAALVLPAAYLLTRPRRGRLLAWWIVAVGLATLWWLVPLLFQSAYGFNFLPYIEQAANTTQTMSATAVLHGSGNWVAYLDFGTPWLSAGWAVVAGPLVVGAVTLVSAAGVYGAARRDLPEGRWLRLAVGIVLMIMLAGYAGQLGGAFHGTVRHLLDCTLAPFRNVYKFEPVLAAALALGLAHGLDQLPGWRPTHRWASRWIAGAASLTVLIGLGLPYATGQVLQPGPFSAVPDYWSQLADYLASRSPTEPAMVVPADAHGVYTWGTTVDDPLEPLATSPWVQDNLVPFSGTGAANMLAAAEHAVESGGRVPGLATYLARAGIRDVVVRNDLDPTQLGYTPPQVVHRTLAESGFHQVAAFGPRVTGTAIYPGTPLPTQALLTSYPSVEVYQADTPPPVPFGPVALQSTADTLGVAGDPASLLQLADQGTLTDQPVVVAGDGGTPATSVVTDGFRRQDTEFGLVNQNTSYTYTATGTNPVDDPHGGGGGPPRQMLPVPPRGNQTVATLSGAGDVTASSSGSWLWELPEYDPVNAFDGDPATAWTAGSPNGATGQWLRIAFDHQLNLPAAADIQLLADTTLRPLITKVTVSTATGAATTDLTAAPGRQPLRLPAGPTNWLRLTIDATTGGTSGGLSAGIADVDLPGIHVTRYLSTPPAPTGPVTYSFHRDTNPPLSLATGEPENQLARTFTTTTPTDLRVTATATATPGTALNDLVDSYRPAHSSLTITASSTWGSLPQFRASNLIDGDYQTGWVAGGPNAVLHLRWSGARTISSLYLLTTTGVASAPTSVEVTTKDGRQRAPVGRDGHVTFAPMTTDQLDIGFPTLSGDTTYDPVLGTAQQLPVGLTEIYLPALADLRVLPRPNPATKVALPCGQGPPLTVDGQTYPTSAGGTIGDLTAFTPLAVTLCVPNGTLRLAAGSHRLSSPGSGPLAITDLSLSDAPATRPATASRSVRVLSWDAEQRQILVGPGGSAYLEVHQADSPGWTASLGGTPLTPVRLDGWQLGYEVPAGAGGVVTLSFPPGTWYRAALIGAVVGVAALLAIAVLPGRRRRSTGAAEPLRPATPRLYRWIGALVVVTLLFVVIGGWTAVLVPILAALACLRPGWLPWIAGAAAVTAGACTLVGLGAHVATPGYGAFGAPAQIFALVALAAALIPRFREPVE